MFYIYKYFGFYYIQIMQRALEKKDQGIFPSLSLKLRFDYGTHY